MKAYKLILTVALAALFANGTTTLAVDPDPGTYRSATASGQWNSNSNWEVDDGGWRAADDYPRAGDTATILEDDLIYVDSVQEVASLTVDKKTAGSAGAILDMRASGELKISSSLTVRDDATDPGVFRFSATSGTKPKLKASGSLSISGPVTVTGSLGGEITRVGANTVTINSDGIITNDSGPLTMSSPVDNGGIIRANASDTSHSITFTAAPDAGSIGRFETADHANARMIFIAGTGVTWTTSVTGPYFDVRKGAMTFSDTFGDEAALRLLDGSLTVAAGKSFTADELWVNP